MMGIYRKEMTHSFQTLKGYIFIAMYLALSGVVFASTNLMAQSGDIKLYFSQFTTWFVFLLPILTMGTFSEERKQKTEELLLTAPITRTQVVMEKYLATLSVFLIPYVITFVYPLILGYYGQFQLSETIGNYVGLLLMASAMIAMGQLISLITDSQCVAAILTYALFSLLTQLTSIQTMLTDATLRALASFFDITYHCYGFSYGVFEWMEVVYFVSITALFLFLSIFVLERRRLS